MFDSNTFKKKVKEWIKVHPDGTEQDLLDFCEEMVPPNQYAGNKWLIDQTLSWYKHVLAQRDMARTPYDDADDIA